MLALIALISFAPAAVMRLLPDSGDRYSFVMKRTADIVLLFSDRPIHHPGTMAVTLHTAIGKTSSLVATMHKPTYDPTARPLPERIGAASLFIDSATIQYYESCVDLSGGIYSLHPVSTPAIRQSGIITLADTMSRCAWNSINVRTPQTHSATAARLSSMHLSDHAHGGPIVTYAPHLIRALVSNCLTHTFPLALRKVNMRRPRSTSAIAIAIAIAIGATLLATAPAGAVGVPKPSDEPMNAAVSVQIPLRMVTAPLSTASNGIVEIRIGESEPIPVMLDTGSVGLRLFSGAWLSAPRGVAVSKEALSTGSPAGSKSAGAMKGVRVSAPFSIGGIAATNNLDFQLVATTNPYINGWKAKGVYGILGVGVSRSALPNPLAELPGSAGQGWSIHFSRNLVADKGRPSALILGAPAPGDAVASLPMVPQGTGLNGGLLWNDHAVNACWKIGRTPSACVSTWFDSGFHVLRVKGLVFRAAPTDKAGIVRPGTRIDMSAPGSAFTAAHVVAGRTPSRNLVSVHPVGQAIINTGNALFFQYTITYDVVRGSITLTNTPRIPRVPAHL